MFKANKNFPKIKKVATELNSCKKYRDKLDKIAQHAGVKSTCRDKPVQLTITSIIISHTHAPLQLCIVAPNHIATTCNGRTDCDHG